MSGNEGLILSGDQLVSLWQDTCQELLALSSPLLVDAWAKTSQLKQIEDFAQDKWLCTFACPSSFNALQFEKNLGPLVKNLLQQKLGRSIELKFVFNQLEKEVIKEETESNTPSKQPVLTDLNDSKPVEKEFHDGLFSASVVRTTLVNRAQAIAKSIGLRPDFNFESFAVSGSNEMAHVAALSVASNPGVSYNPLFFYGGVGVGKTHLMQAIGNYVLNKTPETKVIYCTGEEFTNSIIRAIQNKQAFSFKDRFRTCQILLIDDIQFIAGKNAVQEEFFHTFNALVKQNAQVVLTSDRPPHEIALLEDRLKSRFEAGLKIDIQQPSFELRSAILLAKAKAKNIDLPIELAQMIASRIDSARKLEGIVMSLKSEIELKHHQLNQDLVLEILGTQHQQERLNRRLQPSEIITTVANHFSIKQTVIKGAKRQKEIIHARHIAMFLLKSELNLSYSEIGQIFSNRDHTSVLHGVQKINTQINQDSILAQEVEAIKTSLLGGSF